MDRCNSSHFYNLNQTQLELHQLSEFYCTTFNETIGGGWGHDISIPTWYIKLCDKYTEAKYNITCATEAEYKDLGSIYAGEKALKPIFNSKNYEFPILDQLYYKFLHLQIS